MSYGKGGGNKECACMISGSFHSVNEIFSVLGCYAA